MSSSLLPAKYVSTSIILDYPLTVRLWISQPAFGVEKWLWTLNWTHPDGHHHIAKEVFGWVGTEEEAKQEAFVRLCRIIAIPPSKCRQLLDDYQQRLALMILGNM